MAADPEKQAKQDVERLLALPEFRRFLFRLIQMSGILAPATNGSDTRNLGEAEGRRNLGFDILREVEQGQPAQHPDSIFTLIQVFREEAQSTPTETQNGRRRDRPDRYDRNRDIGDGDDRDGGDPAD